MSNKQLPVTAAEKATRAAMKIFRLPTEVVYDDCTITGYYYRMEGPSGTRFIYENEIEYHDPQPEDADEDDGYAG